MADERKQIPFRPTQTLRTDIEVIAACLGIPSINKALEVAAQEWVDRSKAMPEVQEALGRLASTEESSSTPSS